MKEQLDAERLEHERRIERSANLEQPAIHVAVSGAEGRFFRWVEIGAEEEGVPCRLVRSEGQDALALAYDAAQTSRVGVGVAVGGGQAVLQEAHMTANHPVLTLSIGEDPARLCRLAGSNAGRMVKHMPLRFEEASRPAARCCVAPAPSTGVAQAEVGNPDPRMLASVIARAITERGLA